MTFRMSLSLLVERLAFPRRIIIDQVNRIKMRTPGQALANVSAPRSRWPHGTRARESQKAD